MKPPCKRFCANMSADRQTKMIKYVLPILL